MRAGSLRHSVIIQKITETSDGSGGKVMAPVKLWDQKASIEAVDGSEKFAAARQNPLVTHVVTIRYRAGVTPKHRVYWPLTGRSFNIKSIFNPKEKNRSLLLNCEEVILAPDE